MLSSGAGSSKGVSVSAVQLNFADQDATLIGARPTPEDAYKYYVEYVWHAHTGPSARAFSSLEEALRTLFYSTFQSFFFSPVQTKRRRNTYAALHAAVHTVCHCVTASGVC